MNPPRINGIVGSKLDLMRDVCRRLREIAPVTPKRLVDDPWLRAGVERFLQVLTEAAVDVCHRLLSLAGEATTPTARKAIEACVRLGALVDRPEYVQMVQFRNFLVHRYDRIDENVLADVVNRHLDDYERFIHEVEAYAQRRSQ